MNINIQDSLQDHLVIPEHTVVVYLSLIHILRLTNALIERLTKKNAVVINLFQPLAGDNGLNKKFDCGDGVHLSGQGYLVWANTIRPYIN